MSYEPQEIAGYVFFSNFDKEKDTNDIVESLRKHCPRVKPGALLLIPHDCGRTSVYVRDYYRKDIEAFHAEVESLMKRAEAIMFRGLPS